MAEGAARGGLDHRRQALWLVAAGVVIAVVVVLVAAAGEGDGDATLPAGGDERVLAEGVTVDSGDTTATVLRTEASLGVTSDAFEAEGTYVGAEVRVCGTAADVALAWTARTVTGVAEPVPLPPGALEGDHPPLDQTADPTDGGCAEGWVVWDLPDTDAVVRWEGDPSAGWLLPTG